MEALKHVQPCPPGGHPKNKHTHTLITAFTGTLLFSAGTSVRVQIDRFDLTSTTTRMVIMVMM